MRVHCFTTLNTLAEYADDWERLAGGMPFRGWTWLQHWWRHYGREELSCSNLAVLCAFDAKQLVGIAPWHFENAALGGRVLRPLGTGEVCSDYLGVLCQPGREDAVAGALADYLVTNALDDDPHALHWDWLHLDAVGADDKFMPLLADCLTISGCAVNRRPGANCWRLDLPADWDAYLASLGKNLRRDLRRLERDYIETNRAVLHRAERLEELLRAMGILVELHQRRRNKLGEAGCFASDRFLGFYRDVMPDLLRAGRVHLYWLELDGKPVAAEYQLAGNGVVYAYQAGVDPDALDHQPGKMLIMGVIRQAIAEGNRAVDFLRGDEPYKERFGARPCPTAEYRVAPPRAAAQLRHNLWLAGRSVKDWVKNVANNSGRITASSGKSRNNYHIIPETVFLRLFRR